MSRSLPSVSLTLHPPFHAHGHPQGGVVRGVLTVEVPAQACTIDCITAYLECVTQGEEEHVKEYDRVEFKEMRFEPGSHGLEVELTVPEIAPISYSFAKMKVSWQVRASLGVSRSVDDGGQVTEFVRVKRGSGPLPKEMLQRVMHDDSSYETPKSKRLDMVLSLFIALLSAAAGGATLFIGIMDLWGLDSWVMEVGGVRIFS